MQAAGRGNRAVNETAGSGSVMGIESLAALGKAAGRQHVEEGHDADAATRAAIQPHAGQSGVEVGIGAGRW